ncbi:hypothetical protein [Salinactinospora qingdaonensis]|uniref:CDP-Glycerol:Poly(Glycerophosphate) glycerophosphotransferase n=1 Tax=Salinactinospora qingdaonensis TaxID=702744 RepID=A0ABP7FKJ0_9ACTN
MGTGWDTDDTDTAATVDSTQRLSAIDPQWQTLRPSLLVLAIVHNVTSATRMLDVLPALADDPRVQIFLTWTRSSVFTDGVQRLLADTGYPVLTWDQARDMAFDLALTTSLGGELHEVSAPILRIPHGMGYNKYLNQKSEIRNQKSGSAEEPTVFGLSAEWLLHEGRLVPSAIVLSHHEQRERLARDCPEALPATVVAGDPCYDRLIAGLPRRRHHRNALGLREGQRLLVLTSTWGPHSLFGRHPGLAHQLLTELAFDSYRVALILHPNIWYSHGPGQIDAWLAAAQRSGLILVPPREGWRAALLAADAVIGDHGSVPYYAAALGRPVLLDRGGADDVDPTSPIAQLLRTAPALELDRPLTDQLAEAERRRPATETIAARWLSAAPGRSLHLLRRTMYRLMAAKEPTTAPLTATVPPPAFPTTPPTALWTILTWSHDGHRVDARRLPAATLDRAPDADETPGHQASEALLVVWDSEPDRRLTELADVILCPTHELPYDPADWLAETLHHRPGARAAAVYGPDHCLLRTRDGRHASLTLESTPHAPRPCLLASVLCQRAATAPPQAALIKPGQLTVATDTTTTTVTVGTTTLDAV